MPRRAQQKSKPPHLTHLGRVGDIGRLELDHLYHHAIDLDVLAEHDLIPAQRLVERGDGAALAIYIRAAGALDEHLRAVQAIRIGQQRRVDPLTGRGWRVAGGGERWAGGWRW